MKTTLLILVVGILAACAPLKSTQVNKIASETINDVACQDENMKLNVFDNLKSYIITNNEVPSAESLKQAFALKIQEIHKTNPDISEVELDHIIQNLNNLIELLLKTAPFAENINSTQEILLLLSAIDVGDRSTETRSQIQNSVLAQFNKLKSSVNQLSASCDKTEDDPRVTEPGEADKTAASNFEDHKRQAISSGVPLSVLGAKWAFATAYQSCQNLVLPPMTIDSPDVKGIAITGKHADGVGSKREIASLGQVQSSHYYLSSVNNYESGCFNVKKNPLIYDYGGKPYVTTASNSPLNLFKNGGDGTKVLGIDCSGYVFSAMASAGLKMNSKRPLKASDALSWGSTSYVEPQKNGLTCLNKISVSPSSVIRGGDIVAVQGHMLMIEKVGSDPFGLNSIKFEKDCGQANSSKFDFVIIQSSNSKNGIGINRYEARDYLPTSPKMKTGLEKYAYYACKAKFSGQVITPNLGTLSIVRHNGKPECTAPRVSMTNESCIQRCNIL